MELFELSSSAGMELRVLTYGGIVQSLRAPDARGELADLVLGYDSLEEYLQDRSYFGAIVGRFANRIRNGRFHLDGREYRLETNGGEHHVHGGRGGFSRVVWGARPFERSGRVGVVLTHRSPDGEDGYPGALLVRVRYTLTERNDWVVDYAAVSDRPTPVNLTQHTYFNLRGAGAGDVLDHEVTVRARRYTPTDAGFVPTGEILAVHGTALDLTRPRRLRDVIGSEALRPTRGYNHNFVLERGSTGPVPAARVREPTTRRVISVLTTEPGLQLYTGGFLAQVAGKAGKRYGPGAGLCLETQHFPDSPNHAHFPSTILRPGARLASRTIYRFSADRTRPGP